MNVFEASVVYIVVWLLGIAIMIVGGRKYLKAKTADEARTGRRLIIIGFVVGTLMVLVAMVTLWFSAQTNSSEAGEQIVYASFVPALQDSCDVEQSSPDETCDKARPAWQVVTFGLLLAIGMTALALSINRWLNPNIWDIEP